MEYGMLSGKRIFFLVFFILSLSLVQARLFEDQGKYYIESDLEEQWNLISGISFDDIHPDSYLTKDAIFKAYYYDSKTGKDIEIRPDYQAGSTDPSELYTNAFWVFSAKQGKIKYKASPGFINKSRVGGSYKFYAGWNAIGINNEMYGKTPSELKGNCSLLDARIWDASLQSWTAVGLGEKLDFETQDKLIGKGISIKVGGDCGFMKGNVVEFYCGDGTCDSNETEENCAEDCLIMPGNNLKNMSLYSDKQAFLISDNNWKDVLPLVPLTTWTQQEGDVSACQRGYGTPEDVCVYPTLIWHEEDFSDKTLELDKKEFIKNTGLYVSWNFKNNSLAGGNVESDEFTISFYLDDDMYYKMSKGIPRGDLNITGVKIDSGGSNEIKYDVFFNGHELNKYIYSEGNNNYLIEGVFWGPEQYMLIKGENTLTLRRNGGNVLITNYTLFTPYFATDSIYDDCVYDPDQYDIYDLCIRDVQLDKTMVSPGDEITYSITVENICDDIIDLSGTETVFGGVWYDPLLLGEFYKSPYEFILSHLDTKIPSVTLQPGESAKFEITLIYNNSGNLPDYTFDADSIIYFMQQYSPDKVNLVGEISQELKNLLVANPELGAGLQENQIQRIVPGNYLNYWEKFSEVVYVEDDYELALLASTYASLINAPLIVKDYIYDVNSVFENKKVICVGDVSRNCDEEYNLEELQQKYVDETNTTKLILVNPEDLEIKIFAEYETDKGEPIVNIYTRDSLSAPTLASAKQEIILPIKSENYGEVDDYFTSKLESYYDIPTIEEKICRAGDVCSRGFEANSKDISVASNSITFNLEIDIAPDVTVYINYYENAIVDEANIIPVEVSNLGTAVAEDSSVSLYAKHDSEETFTLVNTLSLGDIEAGKYKEEEISWIPTKQGYYQLKLVANCTDDSDSTNNERIRWVEAKTPGPDVSGYFYFVNSPKIGEDLVIRSYLSNGGTEIAGNITIKFYDNDVLFNESSLSSLDSGQGEYFNLIHSFSKGSHKIKMVVELDGDVNLENNVYARNFNLYPSRFVNFSIIDSLGAYVSRIIGFAYDYNDNPFNDINVNGLTSVELMDRNTDIWIAYFVEESVAYTSFGNSVLNQEMGAVSDYFNDIRISDNLVLYNIYANKVEWDYTKNNLVYFRSDVYEVQNPDSLSIYSCEDWDFVGDVCDSGWEDIGYDSFDYDNSNFAILAYPEIKAEAFAVGENIASNPSSTFINPPSLFDSNKFLDMVRDSWITAPSTEMSENLNMFVSGNLFNCDSETMDIKYYFNNQLVKTQNVYCRELSEIILNPSQNIWSERFNYLFNSNTLNITLVFNSSIYLDDEYGLMRLQMGNNLLASCDSLDGSCAPQTETLQVETYFSDKVSYFNFSDLDANEDYYVSVSVTGKDIENISVYTNDNLIGVIEDIYGSERKKIFKISGNDLNNNLEVKLVPILSKYGEDLKYSAEVSVKQILNLPYYLTIISNPDAIPMARQVASEDGCGSANRVETDGRIYGSLNNYELMNIPVGRITGLTSSDVSGYIARDLFFDELPKNKDSLLVIREDYQNEIYEICNELEITQDCNKNEQALEEYARRYFWTSEIQNQFDGEYFYSGHDEVNNQRDAIYSRYSEVYLNLFDDHGNTGGFAGMMDSWYLMENDIYLAPSLVLGLACGTCEYYSQGDLFCMQGIRRGVLAQQGAVAVSYWHQEFDNVLNGVFLDNKTIGEAYLEARNEDYEIGHYNFCSGLEGDPFYALLGDPTWRPRWW